LPILHQAAYFIALDLRRAVRIKDGEVNSIEPDETSVGRQPDVSVASLNDVADGVLREPVLCRPDAETVLIDWGSGIERRDFPAIEQTERSQEK
jgi:hypothetical protein